MAMSVLAALGSLVLERRPDGRFVRCEECPDWCAVLASSGLDGEGPLRIEDVFPFLEVFLPDAERVWRSLVRGSISSDFWTDVGCHGEELHLEARALKLDSREILIITRNEQLFAEKQLLLQRARDLKLAHRELRRETELRDVLVHSLVHDLASPLHGVLGALVLLSELPLDDESKSWVEMALQAARRQEALIADILDVFAAEHGVLQAVPDPADAPDLARVVRDVVLQMRPAAQLRQVTLRVEGSAEPLRVIAESARLTRVLNNLVDNALRHTPIGSTVAVSTVREDGTVRVNVDDRGPGVPEEVLPFLFELSAAGKGGVAGTGLGLYFCRITVERWTGGIGYERRPEGGSRFWIRLALAERARQSPAQ